MTPDRFDLWLERARAGRLETWRLALGFSLALFGSLGLQAMLIGAALVARGEPLPQLEMGALLLASFAVFWVVVPVARGALNRLSPRSLFGWSGRLSGRAFLSAAGAAIVARLGAGGAMALFGVGGEALAVSAESGLTLVAALAFIPLTFIQTGAEELTFRGYMAQALAARARGRVWLWAGLPNMLFAMVHYLHGAPWDVIALQVAFAFAFGLTAMLLVRMEGGLGAAMGFHFANNYTIFLALAASGEELSPQAAITASGADSLSIAAGMALYFGIFIGLMRARWSPFGRWAGLRP